MTYTFSSLTHMSIPAPINAVLAQLSRISQCNTSATNPLPPLPRKSGLSKEKSRYSNAENVELFQWRLALISVSKTSGLLKGSNHYPASCPSYVNSQFFQHLSLSWLSIDNQDSMFKAIEALSKRLDSLGTNMERNLNLVNVNVMNMSERTTALEMKGMHIYIDFRLGLYCFCFNAVCDWSMKET